MKRSFVFSQCLALIGGTEVSPQHEVQQNLLQIVKNKVTSPKTVIEGDVEYATRKSREFPSDMNIRTKKFREQEDHNQYNSTALEIIASCTRIVIM